MLAVVSLLLLSAVPADLRPGDADTAVTFELDSGFDLQAVPENVTWFGPESFSLVGHVPGEPDSSLTLAVRRGVLWGSVRTPESNLRIRPDGASYRVEKVRSEVFRPAREPLTVSRGEAAAAAPVDDGSVLDVLVGYTRRARASAGGTRAIEALVQLGLTEANLAFERSAIHTRLRLVQVTEIDYEEAGDIEGDLELLRRPFDGAADEVHALRDAYGADLVQLVVEEHDGCGNAYLMGGDDPGFGAWAFSVVEWDCIDSSFGLLH